MWNSKLSRRRFLALSSSALASALLGKALGQAASEGSGGGSASRVLRIGAVLPTLTGSNPQSNLINGFEGNLPLNAFTEDLVGNIANLGAQMGADEITANFGLPSHQLKVLIATAPEANSAVRAAERLSSIEEAYAIIGGFSKEEALVLSDLAVKRDFIFLNIGAQDDSLRGESCNSHTFHLAASTTMYLEAMTGWASHAGFHRLFFVYGDSDEQKANYATAEKILKSQPSGSEAGSTMVPANEPLYTGVFDDIKKAEPDLIVLLLEPTEQLIFLGQYETSGLDIETIGYPFPATQTRLFYDVASQQAPKSGAGRHIALWEATLDKGRAGELNSRFLGRFGQAMDPSAWAAYMGIKIMAEAATKAGSTKSADLIKYMEDSQTVFDIAKGDGTSFRPWNHQMRQPLYLVKTNADYQDKTTLQDVATLEGELPALYEPNVPTAKRLDQLGVSEQESMCKLEAVGK